MRYALCLHGIAFGQTDIGNKVDWSGAYPYFRKNVLRPDVDVFLHTWGENSPEWGKLVEAYHPVRGICDKQKEFPGCPETRSIYSRWYSAVQSVVLTAGMNYDGLLIARYDLVFKTKFPWEDLDPRWLWAPKWRQKPAQDSGFLDYWFYSDGTTIRRLVDLYHDLDKWFSEGLKQNGHSVVGKKISEMQNDPFDSVRVCQYGEQPEDFILLRRLLGATN